MKKMKTTIAVALAACVSTQVFAQVKEDTITFSLTGQRQNSVSTSASTANAGTWSAGPRYYQSATTKVTDQDIIHFIAYVKHHNATYYSTHAKLVLVQGELSGFFNITPDLGNSIPQNETYNTASAYYLDGIIDDGSGNGFTADFDAQTDIPNSTDSAFVTLANDGSVRIERGFVRSEDDPASKTKAEDQKKPSAKDADGFAPLSEKLVAELTAYRTAALRNELAQHPASAFIALVHTLTLATFFQGSQGSCYKAPTGQSSKGASCH